MQTFRDHLTERGLSTSTANTYITDMGLFAAWYHQTNGERLGTAFTPTDVREYRAHLITVEEAQPATINRKLAALRAYGAYLEASGQAEYNPAAKARNVKEKRPAPKWLDRTEQGRLTRELEARVLSARSAPAKRDAIRNQAIVTLLLHTGLRVAELCALNVEHVVADKRGGQVSVRHGKGDRPRDVPLNVEARRALAEWIECAGRTAGAALFIGRTGGRLEPRGVQRLVAELGRRAKIESLSPHTLRHTFAKNLRNAGVDIEKVALLMGHSSIETTAIYTVPDGRDLARAVETLED